MLISGRSLGDGHNIILSQPGEPGSCVIPADAVLTWTWSLSLGTTMEEVTAFDDHMTRSYRGIRPVDGTISFSAMNCIYYPGQIDPTEPVIKEYSVSDMLQIIKAKLEDRK